MKPMDAKEVAAAIANARTTEPVYPEIHEPGLPVISEERHAPTVTHSEGDMFAMIERMATNPMVDADKLEKLLNLNERVMAKNSEIAFNQAMTRLQEKLPRIRRTGSVAYKNKDNGKLEEAFKFARYEDIDGAIRPFLLEEGFSLSFNTKWGEAGPTIYGTLAHQLGHSRTVEMRLPLDASGGKNNLQGMGSTVSYGKRYCVGMLLNIVTVGEDDGGLGEETDAIDTEKAAEIDKILREKEKSAPDKATGDKVRPWFFKHMGVNDVREIAASDYNKALTAAKAIGSKK